MLTLRDSLLVTGTLAAVLLYQNGSRYFAKWKGARVRQLNPLIPAQIPDDDDDANWDNGYGNLYKNNYIQ